MNSRNRKLLKPGALLQYNLGAQSIFQLVKVERFIRSEPYMYLLVNILTKVEIHINRGEMLNFTEITEDSPSYKSYKVLYAN